MTRIDLRAEPCLRPVEATAASLRGDRFAGFDEFIRTAELSDNAACVLDTLKSDDFKAMLLIADHMEAGRAISEAEDMHVYEQVPEIVDLVLDLFNMVARRDELIAELREQISGYEAQNYDAQQG